MKNEAKGGKLKRSRIAYNFPATKFTKKNSPGDQLAHILSEMREIRDAVANRFGDLGVASLDDHVLEELADLSGSLETFWLILEKLMGREFVTALFDRVEDKNCERGYYLGASLITHILSRSLA